MTASAPRNGWLRGLAGAALAFVLALGTTGTRADVVAVADVETTPIWLSISVAKVHHATFDADPKSVPLRRKSSRSLTPDLRMGMSRISACVMTPNVARPAKTAICSQNG